MFFQGKSRASRITHVQLEVKVSLYKNTMTRAIFSWVLKVNPLHLTSVCKFSILFFIHYLWRSKENLSNNQELLKFPTISVILMNLMFNLGVILLGDIRYLSLLGVNPLTLMSDQERISPYNINTISSIEVRRMK